MHVSEEKERVPNYRPVYVTEISDSLHFYTQDVETGNVGACFVQLCMNDSYLMKGVFNYKSEIVQLF